MPKTLKIIILSIVGIIVLYFAYFIFDIVRYGYHIEMGNHKPYFWIFKDSAKKDVNKLVVVGCIRKRDIYYHYHCSHDKRDYGVGIWEFKDLSSVELKNTSISQNINLDNVKFSSGEVLHANRSPEITVRFGSFLKSTIDINLDEQSKIEKNIETSNYKGFYGILHKMSFSDKEGHWVLFNYHPREYCLFLLYKAHQSFYVVMINSEQPFSTDMINILNLS